MRIFGVIFLSVLVSACSTPTVRPPVALFPITNVASSSVGNQKPVIVNVVDARNQSSYSTANISASQNVSTLMAEQINLGLKKQGFNTQQNNQDKPAQLNIKLITMDYRALSGYMSSNTETFVSAEVSATNSSGSTMTKTYNATAYNDSYVNLSAQTPSAQVTQAFDKLLNNILNDASLTQFLVKP
jgi:uncharacterized lipoprotein YajG